MKRRDVITGFISALISFSSARAFAFGFSSYQAEKFQELLAKGSSVVVHVHADWCPVCKKQTPILNSLAKDNKYSKVYFIKVNYDTDLDFLRKYWINHQAAVLVFKGDHVISNTTGVTNAERLTNIVKDALAAS